MPNFISEDQIGQALVQKLQHVHGFEILRREELAGKLGFSGTRRARARVSLMENLVTAVKSSVVCHIMTRLGQ